MSLMLTFFGFIYFIQPEWVRYSQGKEALLTTEQKYQEINENKTNFDVFLTNFNDLNFEKKSLIEKSIPLGFSEEVFLNSLNLIVADSGVILKSADFKKTSDNFRNLDSVKKDEIEKASVALSLTGNYFQLKKALYLIESMERLVLVDSFNLTKDSGSKSSLSLNLNLSIFNKENKASLNISRGNDSYLMTLLKEGLDVDFINNYEKYRGLTSNFNFDESEPLGRDSLFSEEQLNNEEEIDTEIVQEAIEVEDGATIN